MAPRKSASSRAMATTTGFACWPRAIKRRARWHRRTGAFQRRSWMVLGCGSSRRGLGRLTLAGYRSAQAPSTRARRAWGFPAVVIAPGRRRAPREYSAGIRPREFISGLGVSTRVRSPRAAPRVTAPVHGTPRRASRASTTGGSRQELTCSGRSCPGAGAVRCAHGRRAPYAWKPMGCAGVAQPHVGEPPPMGRAPGRATRLADIVAEPKGVETTRGGLESGDGIFPSPAEVTTGCVFPRRHIDGGEVT